MNWKSASMNCDSARETIADSIMGRRALDDELQAHLAGCDSCRSYRVECEAMWSALGEDPVPPQASDARARFDLAVRREISGGVAVRGSVPRRWSRAAVAAAVAAATLFGYGTASWRAAAASRPATIAADSSPRFLLLLYDRAAADAARSPGEMERIIAEYSAWGRGLRDAGSLVSAEKLTDDAGRWLGGPVATNTGERIGGFFLIRARDYAAAQRIAAGCPHLKYGGRIELRSIHPT